MFTYPLRGAPAAWLIGLALAAAPIQALTGVLGLQLLPQFRLDTSPDLVVFGMIGLGLDLLWWVTAFKIAVEALRAASSGHQGGDLLESWTDDAQALRQFVFWVVLATGGYLLHMKLGSLASSLYFVLVALLAPATVVLLGMFDSLLRALDPRALHALVRKAGADYLVVCAKLAGLALLLGLLLLQFSEPLPRWLGVPLSRLACLYLLFAGYHELGRMLERHRHAIETPEGAPPAPADEPSSEEEMALRAAARYAAENRLPKAAQQLEGLVRVASSSAQVHLRYRDLLLQAGDYPGLLQHARHYLPWLLDAGKEREALALYQDSLALDPGFELAEPGRVGHLVALATQEQQPQLAISLAREFLRRFPDEPDAVPAGLSAARLLDRLGHDEDARQLLVDLVRRFPSHPLRGELVAALETLEAAARRGR